MKFVINVLFFLLLVTTAFAESGHLGTLTVIQQYFDFLSSGAYDIAGDMWTPEALERSRRFGIQYEGIVLKPDCNSPIIRNIDMFETGIVSPIRNYESLEENNWYKLEFSDVQDNQLLQHYYYLQRRGDWFWLSYPQDFYASDWPITETKYFRIHVDPGVSQYLNPVVTAEADSFVESIADRIGMADNRLELIADKKIEYFYCASDSVVEKLSGFLVKGTLDLASNDVISADFPHFHELTHLLTNIHLQELPLYSHPLTREGLAVYLGGRWGKHPAALMDLAVFLYREGLVEFDSILTMDGFRTQAGADIVYPVAGSFCEYLIDCLGMDRFYDLYLRLSGDFEFVNGLTAPEVQQYLIEACNRDSWDDLMGHYDRYLDEHQAEERVALPGLGDRGEAVISDNGYEVFNNGDWLAFKFQYPAGQNPVTGNLVFGRMDGLVGSRSALFDAQYESAEIEFEGYRYGVKFDQFEAGLYDYATNRLMAKYIWGITPSEEYFDEASGTVTFRIRKSILNGTIPQTGDCELLPR